MLKENLSAVLEFIKNGNPFGESITLVGATKFVDVSVINEAISLGLKVVAENQVQEFIKKTDFIKGASQHFIGHLQTNKVNYLVGKVELIHSVDSVRLLDEISKRAQKLGVVQDVLLEINVKKEPTKSGLYLENLEDVLNIIKNYSGTRIKGFMCVLPICNDKEELAGYCKVMRTIYETYKNAFNLEYLSMGMSADYKTAIEYGSNMIRLGSTIFGPRNYGDK